MVETKVNKGKTESIKVNVEGAIFSEFPGTKVEIAISVSFLHVTFTFKNVFSTCCTIGVPELQCVPHCARNISDILSVSPSVPNSTRTQIDGTR